MTHREEILRHLTLGDAAYLEELTARRSASADAACLDHVGSALDAGVGPDEIVDALVVLAPVLGRTRIVDVAPKLALAVGYDVRTALETR